jgi:hypothetical protein
MVISSALHRSSFSPNMTFPSSVCASSNFMTRAGDGVGEIAHEYGLRQNVDHNARPGHQLGFDLVLGQIAPMGNVLERTSSTPRNGLVTQTGLMVPIRIH